jgi:hypothetical protein
LDVWGITLAALRRWYVFIPILALSAFVAYSAGQGVAPEYEASATALLTPPPTQPTVANPFGNPDDANIAIGIVLNGPVAQLQVRELGLNGAFTVDTASRSAVLNIVARSDDSAEDAVATTVAVLDLASAELKSRQEAAGVPSTSLIGLQVLSPPHLSSVATQGALRVQAVILLLGAAAALVISVLFDDIIGLFRRRGSRRRRQKATSHPVIEAEAVPTALISLPENDAKSERRQASRLTLSNRNGRTNGGGDTSAEDRPTNGSVKPVARTTQVHRTRP